mgnify:CR=1 FL=1
MILTAENVKTKVSGGQALYLESGYVLFYLVFTIQ